MTNSLPELIIKVGNKSVLSFSHSKAYRVVTYEELVITSEHLKDCHVLIIEGIIDDEYTNIRNFIQSFKEKDEANKVFIYTENESDENINGLIDEFGFDIYTTQNDLFRDIYDKTKLNITTNIELRAQLNKLEQTDVNDDPFSDFNFDNEVEEKQTRVDEVEEQKETENTAEVSTEHKETESELKVKIEKKEIIDINELNKANKVRLEKPTQPEKQEPEHKETDTKTKVLESEAKVEVVEHKEKDNKAKVEVVEHKEEDKEEDKEVIIKDTKAEAKVEELSTELNKHKAEKEKLESEKVRLEVEKEKLEVKIKDSEERIETLTKLNKTLNNKYEAVVNEYNAIVNSDELLEDPITLTEYSELKSQIRSLETALKEQKESAEREVSKLESQIEDTKLQLEELKQQLEVKENELVESKQALEDKQNELVLLNEQVASGEIQSEELEVSKKEIEDLKSAIEDLEIVVKAKTKDINKLKDKIDNIVDKNEKENFGRQSSLEFNRLLVKKLSSMSEELQNLTIENEEHREYIESLRDSDEGNNAVIAGQTAEIIQLRKQLKDMNTRIEEAVQNERYEKSLLNKQLAELQQEFDFQREQLELKESQYNKLRAVTTLDENGANILEEDNKTLRDINNALRMQLKASQDETEKVRNEKVKEQQMKHMLEDQVNTMKASIRSLQVGMSGGVTQTANLPAINYQGKGTILSVFGCGSYGTTITAISLAKRLAQTSKVLYIDLDLLAPKSDAFFNLPPILKDMPGFNANNSRTYTGMGLFFEQGMSPLIHNREQSIIHVEPQRRGCLDYLGGVYYKIDPVKVLSADFGALLNYCGNTYQNVVIDLGRIGASDLSDKVIKVITDASVKSIGVTSSDIVDIRLLRMKMMDAKLNLNKVAVLVNMCDSSKLDQKAIKFISPSLYGLMPFWSDLYGNRKETFIERRSRDKFDNFISNVVFRN